jgi:hypothetical protein
MEASTNRATTTFQEGFGHLSYELQGISYGLRDLSSKIADLNATFHWGFGAIIAALGHMNDALSQLIQIAKTPVQTVALNHFEIARDAFRQGLYRECLEKLEKPSLAIIPRRAIDLNGVSTIWWKRCVWDSQVATSLSWI